MPVARDCDWCNSMLKHIWEVVWHVGFPVFILQQLQGDQMCPFQDEDRKTNIPNKENPSQLFLRLKVVRQGAVSYSEGSQYFVVLQSSIDWKWSTHIRNDNQVCLCLKVSQAWRKCTNPALRRKSVRAWKFFTSSHISHEFNTVMYN